MFPWGYSPSKAPPPRQPLAPQGHESLSDVKAAYAKLQEEFTKYRQEIEKKERELRLLEETSRVDAKALEEYNLARKGFGTWRIEAIYNWMAQHSGWRESLVAARKEREEKFLMGFGKQEDGSRN